MAARRRTAEPEAGPADYTPVAPDAEMSLLAALLTDPEVYDEVSELLEPESFGVPAHVEIYRAITACDAAGKPFDQITVADQLKKAKQLDRLGGINTLSALVEMAPEANNISSYVEIITDKALRRQLVEAGRGVGGAAMNPALSAKEALGESEQLVFELGKSRERGSLVDMQVAVPAMMEELKKGRRSVLMGTSTGFKDLDRMTGGLQGGQLVILAARPAIGKSALALQIARNMSESSGKRVPFLSYEMSTGELTMRMLSTALRFDLSKLRRGDLPPGMDHALSQAVEDMRELHLLIDDNPPETIGGVRSSLRRLARTGDLGGVVIDYLQLMSAEKRFSDSNRVQEVSDISRGLKRLANELDVPVVALSQLNRGLEARPNKRPMLSDLRESGSLEQDASLVMFLYRDSVYNAASDPGMAELILAKQRNGPTGVIHLDFQPECARFDSTDRRSGVAVPNSGGGGNDY